MLARIFQNVGTSKKFTRVMTLVALPTIVLAAPVAGFVVSELTLFAQWQREQAEALGDDDASYGAGFVVLNESAGGGFGGDITKPKYWSRKRKGKGGKSAKIDTGQRSGVLTSQPPPNAFSFFQDWQSLPSAPTLGGTYRTVCVRTCDGYFWPMSYSATSMQFDLHAAACQASCEAPARLFYYANPGQEPIDMVDLAGQPYNTYDFAWRYQSAYDAQCKCRPHPWEPAAIKRHETYARLQKEGKLAAYLDALPEPMSLGRVPPRRALGTGTHGPTVGKKRRARWQFQVFAPRN